jgi:hypothetical protein
MNHEPDHEQLLADVLAEGAPAGFREAMLGETLRLARRRRRWRQTRRAATWLVMLGLLAVLVRQNFPPQTLVPTPAAEAKSKGYEPVQTRPLPVGMTVVTRPLSAEQMVASAGTVETVQTRDGDYRLINDDELLALVASRPAGLIRTGPHSERLVFANPDDEKGFPVN